MPFFIKIAIYHFQREMNYENATNTHYKIF